MTMLFIGRPVKSIGRVFGLVQRSVRQLRPETQHQLVAHHTTDHVAVPEQREATEHLLLRDAVGIRQGFPEARCEVLVVSHPRQCDEARPGMAGTSSAHQRARA